MKKLVLVLTMALSFAFVATAVMADPGPYDTTECADPNGGAFTPCETGTVFDVYEAINKVFDDTGDLDDPNFTSNADADSVQWTNLNEYWRQLSDADSSEFAFISITAAATNELGVYSEAGGIGTTTFLGLAATGDTFTGSGSEADPYPGIINPLADESFGFALKSTKFGDPDQVNTWYSDPDFNADEIDHMLTYHLPLLAGNTIYVQIVGEEDPRAIVLTEDTFLIAWEDRNINQVSFDSDYNDSIFLVTKVAPPVIPEPMSMLLLGSGLAAMAGTRRRKRS